jgi:hypothetical protein
LILQLSLKVRDLSRTHGASTPYRDFSQDSASLYA